MSARALALAASIAFASLSVACGTSACVVPSPVQTPAWDHCYDDWTPDECSDVGGNSQGGTCESLGFTKQCPGETNTYRRPSYSC